MAQQVEVERLTARDIVLGCAMTVMVIATGSQVALRYVVGTSLSWSEEVVRYVMVWMAFLAGAWSVREQEHIVVEAFMSWLPPRGLQILTIARHLSVAIFCVAVLPSAVSLTVQMHSQLGTAIEIPLSLVFAALPVALVLMAYYSLVLASRTACQLHTTRNHRDTAET